MIVTVTPNPALDRTLIAPGFRHSDVARVQGKHDSAGGKGLNVTRALQRIGVPCRAVVPLGGPTGTAVAAMARAEGFSLTVVPISGDTRTCISVTDPAAPDQLVINEPGPSISAAEWAALCQAVHEQSRQAQWLTISGSIPPGVAAADFCALIDSVASGCQVAVDTSGAPLRAVLHSPVALLKINRSELAGTLEQPLDSDAALISAMRDLCTHGPHAVVVSLGAAGAIAVDGAGAWHISAPEIIARSPVGSGDCMLAGVVAARSQGAALPDAVAAGVAAGSANALVPHAGVFDLATYEQFRQQAQITHLS